MSRAWRPVALTQSTAGGRAPPLPFQFRPQETSRGSLSSNGKWLVAAGQAPFLPWRRRASTDSKWCWGPPLTDGIFTVFSSQGRAPSLDEGSVYWAGACTGPSTPAESEPSALRVPSMSGPRPVLIPPARGFAPSRGVSGVAALGQTPQGALHGPVSRPVSGPLPSPAPVKVAASRTCRVSLPRRERRCAFGRVVRCPPVPFLLPLNTCYCPR